MSKHTPTPWFRDTSLITHADGVIGEVYNDVKANAEFIVRACNAHDDLKAALERARDCLLMWVDARHGAIVQIDAAIAKAEGR